jgi:hypothetical protein
MTMFQLLRLYSVPWDGKMIVSGEYIRKKKETVLAFWVVTLCSVVVGTIPALTGGGTRKTMRNFSHGN